jgi:hypothetical protein
MLSVVTGWPSDIGDEMITNPNIDLITFTGGVPVGKLIAAKAGYKRQVLELGGNDPLIILNDLRDDDLARAADLAVAGATKNPASAARRSSASSSRRASPTASCRWCWNAKAEVRRPLLARPISAPSCTNVPPRCSKTASIGPPNRGGRAHHPGRQARCCPPSSSTASTTPPNSSWRRPSARSSRSCARPTMTTS